MVALLERLDRAEGEREAGAGAAAAQAAVRAAEEATTRAEAAAKEAEAARARAEERAASVEAGLRAADDRRAQAEAVAKAAEAASESAAATAKAAEEARETAEATARSAQADREAANAAARAAQERAEAAERTGAEAVSRVTELEGADDRAERSRKALAELREQAEREQELHARREQELEDALSARDGPPARRCSKRIAELAEAGRLPWGGSRRSSPRLGTPSDGPATPWPRRAGPGARRTPLTRGALSRNALAPAVMDGRDPVRHTRVAKPSRPRLEPRVAPRRRWPSGQSERRSQMYRSMGRAHAWLSRAGQGLRAQRGQGTVEYVALILLVALVIAGVVAAMKGFRSDDGKELGDVILSKIKEAVRKVQF